MITATDFTDPRINSIRSNVGRKDDGIPFLLLPVKVETRFMRVDRPAGLERGGFVSALGSLYAINDEQQYEPGKLPEHEVLGKVRNAGTKVAALTSELEALDPLPDTDQEQLRKKAKQIEQDGTKLDAKLSRVPWTDTAQRKALKELRNELHFQIARLQGAVDQLNTVPVEEPSSIAPLLDCLEAVNSGLVHVCESDPSASDRQSKRALHSYLDGQLVDIDRAIALAKKELNKNPESSPAQLAKLDQLRDRPDAIYKEAVANVRKLKSNYKKATYLEALKARREAISGLYQEIENRFKPKLEMQLRLERIPAKDLFCRITELRYQIRSENRRSMKRFADRQSSAQRLLKQLEQLKGDIHKVIQGGRPELDAIGQVWDGIEKDLRQYLQRLVAFKGTEAEKQALDQLALQLTSLFDRDLAGLKSANKSNFAELNNTTLEKSAIAFSQCMKQLQEIESKVAEHSGKSTSRSLNNAVKQLIDFRASFEEATEQLHVLPASALTELHEAADRVATQVDRAVAADEQVSTRSMSRSTSNHAKEAAEAVRALTGAVFSDTPDRPERLAESPRNALVFARNTAASDELWVRIYPDDIAVHSHEAALTADEVAAGKAYWYEIWAANDDYEIKLAAWRAISTAYGSQRAAWIVRSLEPAPEEVEAAQNRFKKYSRNTVRATAHLQELVELLSADIPSTELIETVGTAYPVLEKANRTLDRVKRDHLHLLQRTQNLLIKLQSLVGKLVQRINEELIPARRVTEAQMATVRAFISTFTATARHFTTIEKVASKEVIRQEVEEDLFPEVSLKDESWTEAPHSRVMPDRFAVLTMRGEQFIHIAVGNPLPADRLVVGLDPATFDTDTFEYDEDGNLIVDPSIEWLTDFEAARQIGMALTIPIDEEDVNQGFDRVLVLGIKDTTEAEGQALIEQLIENHHYLPEGASFLPIGTPTNNTEVGKSGYRTFEEDAAGSFAVERNNEEPVSQALDPEFPTNAERLASGLGIQTGVFLQLDHQGRTEISEALTLNKALFHGTIGNYMEEGLDQLFTLDNINFTKEFFTNFVSARGFLPSLRIGTQPYGILPTTAFSEFNATANDSSLPVLMPADFDHPAVIADDLRTRYDIRLRRLLDQLDRQWTTIREAKVPYSGNTNPADPQGHFMEMLGLQATSEEHYYRYGLNVAARKAADEAGGFSISFGTDDPWGPNNAANTFRMRMLDGYYYNSDKFADEREGLSPLEAFTQRFTRITEQFTNARVFATRHLRDQSQLLGQLIDSRELAGAVVASANPFSGTPEERAAAQAELQNYIDWLISENPWEIHAQNRFAEVVEGALIEGLPSKSLLFLLLRHSILSAYADAILKVLEREGLTDQVTRKKLGQPGHFYNRFAGGYNYVTKWSYLFSRIDRLDGLMGFKMDTNNAFYAYMNGQSGSNGYLNRYLSPSSPSVFQGYSNRNQHQSIVMELDDTREAIGRLKDIPTAHLNQLLQEHIDLCTYRLDAWRLGMVNKRLQAQRAAQPTGIFLGAYGFVEDLKKGDSLVPLPRRDLPDGLWKRGDDPIYPGGDNEVFIHTPSLNHAITAAILKAGFDANKDTAEIDNPLAVNLSSARVRMALQLLSGIRAGQDAAAMLGYQFERGLHERYLHIPLELDQYIYDFRDEFPLAEPVDASLTLGEATVTNVVNGMELLETAQDFIEDTGGPPNPGDSLYQSLKAREAAWWSHIGNANLSAASAAKRDAMLQEIDRMADAFDALGDLCISESVYQVVQGNHIRASAIMEKLAKGDVPNDISIADTPRTGTVLTQKVALFVEAIRDIDQALTDSGAQSLPLEDSALETAVSAAGARPAGWNGPFTPRALADPSLNKWAGQMIGDPARVQCQVQYTIGDIQQTLTVSLADLAIQPLDVLQLFGTGPLDGGAELNARIGYYTKQQLTLPVDFEGTADEAELTILYTKRHPDWTPDVTSFYEKAAYIQALRTLLTNSGVLAADHLLIPGEEEVSPELVRNQDVGEALVRITNLFVRLQLMENDWNAFLTNEVALDEIDEHSFADSQIDALRNLLVRSAAFGIPGAVPDNQFGYGDAVGSELMNAAAGVTKAVSGRLKQAAKELAVAEDETKTNEARIAAIREASKRILGKAFVFLPQFYLRNAAALSEQLTLPTEKGLLRSASSSLILEEWAQGLSRVRERMAVLDTIEMWAEAFGAALPDRKPVQFPFSLDESGTAIDHWLGMELPPDYQSEEDKLSVVLMNTSQLTVAPEAPKTALLLDEWVEIIPSKEETTGVTFNYDQPDAKPPNNLLLAVTPRISGTWRWDDLVHTLVDTLELAKNRAVEPEHLDDTVFGQILPGIMMEIVPPQLLPEDGEDSGDAQDNPLGLQVVTDFGVVNDTYEPEES